MGSGGNVWAAKSTPFIDLCAAHICKNLQNGAYYCINWIPNENNSTRTPNFTILYLREKFTNFVLTRSCIKLVYGQPDGLV